MKSIRKVAVCLLTAMLALLVLTACDGTASVTQTTWETSRTKQYYESHGVTGNAISIKATVSSAGVQGEYIFTRNDECAYVKSKAGTIIQIWLTDAEGYVYATSEGYSNWTRHEPNSIYGDYANLIRAGYSFIIPNEQNVESVKTEEVVFFGKKYTAENLRLNVNGTPFQNIYYYGENGLEMVESMNAIYKIVSLSGVPDPDLLKVPTR